MNNIPGYHDEVVAHEASGDIFRNTHKSLKYKNICAKGVIIRFQRNHRDSPGCIQQEPPREQIAVTARNGPAASAAPEGQDALHQCVQHTLQDSQHAEG